VTLALHEMYDGNEPRLDLDADLAIAIRERTDELRERPLDAYTCENGHRVFTRSVHIGMTPLHIQCPTCGQPAKSAGRPRITQVERDLIEQRNREIDERKERGVVLLDGITKVDTDRAQPPWVTDGFVTIEWYRPGADEFETLDPEQQEYVMRGGLVQRDIIAP
jgi:hypothetical protein